MEYMGYDPILLTENHINAKNHKGAKNFLLAGSGSSPYWEILPCIYSQGGQCASTNPLTENHAPNQNPGYAMVEVDEIRSEKWYR